ncbi:MAG: hypothetical protein MHM6MM_000672 [Cercozoa sp. M6MM]
MQKLKQTLIIRTLSLSFKPQPMVAATVCCSRFLRQAAGPEQMKRLAIDTRSIEFEPVDTSGDHDVCAVGVKRRRKFQFFPRKSKEMQCLSLPEFCADAGTALPRALGLFVYQGLAPCVSRLLCLTDDQICDDTLVQAALQDVEKHGGAKFDSVTEEQIIRSEVKRVFEPHYVLVSDGLQRPNLAGDRLTLLQRIVRLRRKAIKDIRSALYWRKSLQAFRIMQREAMKRRERSAKRSRAAAAQNAPNDEQSVTKKQRTQRAPSGSKAPVAAKRRSPQRSKPSTLEKLARETQCEYCGLVGRVRQISGHKAHCKVKKQQESARATVESAPSS